MMLTPAGLPVVPSMSVPTALRRAASLMRMRSVADLYTAMTLTGAPAAVRGRCFAAVRQELLGSSEPGDLTSKTAGLGPLEMAAVCERAASLVE